MCDRLPLSAAYFDPAYINCLSSAIAEPELVFQFCRLYGSKLDTPQRTDDDMRAFSAFVHDAKHLSHKVKRTEALAKLIRPFGGPDSGERS